MWALSLSSGITHSAGRSQPRLPCRQSLLWKSISGPLAKEGESWTPGRGCCRFVLWCKWGAMRGCVEVFVHAVAWNRAKVCVWRDLQVCK